MIRAALLLLASAGAAQADALFSYEVEAAFMDRAFFFEEGEAVGQLAFTEDGRLLTREGTGYSSAGSWRMNGRRLCVTTNLLNAGKESCARVTPDGDKYVMGGIQFLPTSDIGFLNQ